MQTQITACCSCARVSRRPGGFTLIELVVVIVILGALAAVAVPAYFDHGDRARKSADEASISGIRTALSLAFTQHRMEGAPSSEWVTSVDDIAGVMEIGKLPQGVVIQGGKLIDQRGNRFTVIPETAGAPAKLSQDPSDRRGGRGRGRGGGRGGGRGSGRGRGGPP